MKLHTYLILFFLQISFFGHTQTELADYTSKIYGAVFTDTVFMKDNGVEITGYFIDEEVVKAKLTYPETDRIRIVFYKQGINTGNDVCMIKQYNKRTKRKEFTITAWNDTITTTDFPTNVTPKKILNDCDYTVALKFKRIDDKAQKYDFVGKLVETLVLPPYCGTIAWATAYKFELIESEFETHDPYVLIIIPCPRTRGEEFYEEGALYKGILSTNSGVIFAWSIENNYSAENWPIFWANTIKKVKKRNEDH